MANPHRGEVPLRIGDRVYTLRCGNNALAELEEAIGVPVPQLWQRWSDGVVGIRELRAMLWAFARGAHRKLTLEDAGNLLDEAGTEPVTAALLKALQLGFPSAGNGDGADPRTAAGTGSDS